MKFLILCISPETRNDVKTMREKSGGYIHRLSSTGIWNLEDQDLVTNVLLYALALNILPVTHVR